MYEVQNPTDLELACTCLTTVRNVSPLSANNPSALQLEHEIPPIVSGTEHSANARHDP